VAKTSNGHNAMDRSAHRLRATCLLEPESQSWPSAN
jgi:hypothetical protein